MTYDWTFIAGVVFVSAAAVAVMVTLILWLCGKISDEKLMRIWKKLCYLVPAAEMMFGPDTGEQKMEWVLGMLQSWGIKITDKVVAMAEAVVMELTHTKVAQRYYGEDNQGTNAENAEE